MKNPIRSANTPSSVTGRIKNWSAVVDEVLRRSRLHIKGSGDERAMRCPYPDDHNDADADPSASINVVKGVWRCHGCGATGNMRQLVDALDLGDEWPKILEAAGVARKSIDIKPATDIREVARWLRTKRQLPAQEVAKMWAAETRSGAAVVFRYTDETGERLYDKFRHIGMKDGLWRAPKGATSVLYGLAELSPDAAERVIVVEGELDVHTLRAVGIGPVVSVPDGAQSKLTTKLLAPLAPFKEVVIATDADGPGEDLAQRLATELGAARCRRARFIEEAS